MGKPRAIAVIGLGDFGFHFSRALHERGLDVIAIDERKDVVQLVSRWASKAIVADARDKETLQNIGLSQVDVAVVSLGTRMDASILAALHLKSLGVKQIYVKAITDDHAQILEKIGVTEVIFPEREMAERLAFKLLNPNVIEYLRLMQEFSILELAPPKDFRKKTLMQLDLPKQYHITVIAVNQIAASRMVVIPPADYVIKDDDALIVVGRDDDIERFRKVIA